MENKKLQYTDIELLSFMECEGLDTSYSSLISLKEHIEEYEESLNEFFSLFKKKKKEKPTDEPTNNPKPADANGETNSNNKPKPENNNENKPKEVEKPIHTQNNNENKPKEVEKPIHTQNNHNTKTEIVNSVNGTINATVGRKSRGNAIGGVVIGDNIKHSSSVKTTTTNNKPLKEDYLSERRANEFLKIFLIEECGMSLNEYEQLSNENKIESIKEIAVQLLSVIQNKISEVDSSSADRSRGDIKSLRELPVLQDAITQLESLIERDENAIPEYSRAVGIIIKSILYINQYSNVFKEAYRNKKTLMILKYESLILSIISSVSYLISTIVDYKANYLTLKRNVEGIMNFAPLRSLEGFVASVDSGEFKIVTNDTAVMREYYLEVSVETMSTILEATDYLPMIVNSVKEIYQSVVGNGKLTNLIYKAVGVVILLFSLRDTFYTLSRMKTKVNDMIGGISNFAGLNDGGNMLQKLSQFSNKFKVDAEMGSDMTKREIEDENRRLLNQVKQVQVKNPANNNPIEIKPVEDNLFGFDF